MQRGGVGSALALVLFAAACGGAPSGHDLAAPTDGGSDAGDLNEPTDLAGDAATCDPSLRACAHIFTWTFTGGSEQPDVVEVRGSFNNWAAGATPMTFAGGSWSATVALPWGADVEYKFYALWNDNPNNPLWVTDPGNSNVAADGNSELVNVMCATWTCTTPSSHLELVGPVVTSASAYSFQVRFVPGAADIDTTKTAVTLNGATTSVPYDPSSHLFTISITSGVVSPSKLAYRFTVQDLSGVPATLYVPFWIEATTFTWRDAFMYEVMIDRFLAGGTSKAGPNGSPTDPVGDWKGGDFGGVTAKINAGYFDAMGVNTLWISSPVLGTNLCEMGTGANASHCLSGYHSYFPIASGWTFGSENDATFTSHGVTNPIDPHFGTADDLKALVQAAHAHGIRVLTDLVVNHVFADAAPPNGQTPQLAPLWIAHQTDATWFNIPYNASTNDCGNENLWDTPTSATWNRANCWFDPYLPDFNTSVTAVNDAVAQHAVWLMETFDLDGFRVDAAKQVTNNICVDLRKHVAAEIATGLPFFMVGEALGGDVDNVMDCVGADRLDGSMDDPLHNSIVATFLSGVENANSFDSDVQSDESTWTGRYGDAIMGHFFGSHDVPRAISEAANDVGDPWNSPPPASEPGSAPFQRLGMAQAFLLTYGAMPILWMGDELGMPGSIDPDNRRMMRFDGALSANEAAALGVLQKLGTARAAHSALRHGARTRLWVDNTFYAYGRTDGTGDIVVAAFNLDPSNPATHAIPVNNIGLTGTVTDVLSGTSATVSGNTLTLTLAPLTAAVYTN